MTLARCPSPIFIASIVTYQLSKPIFSTVPLLNDKLLWNLLNDLYPVRAKWKVIGLGLGAKNSDLDTITGSHTECLQSILTEWLKGINPYPSWNALLDVLKAPVVDEAKLAAELEEKINSASNSQG